MDFFSNFDVVDFPKRIECAVCLEPWTEPIELHPCKHIFCSECVASLNTCPTCRTSIQRRDSPNRVLLEIADESTKVRCKHCGWEGSREDSQHHKCAGMERKEATRTTPTPATAPTNNAQHPPEDDAHPASSPFPWVAYNMSQENYDQVYSLFLQASGGDGDGKLDARTFVHFAPHVGIASNATSAQKMFDDADEDRSGFVDVHKILKLISRRQEEDATAHERRAAQQRNEQSQRHQDDHVIGHTLEQWKERGNKAFQERNFSLAHNCYQEGVRAYETYARRRAENASSTFNSEMPRNLKELFATLVSNLSASLVELKQFDKALKQADHAIRLRPNWFRGYIRAANALEARSNRGDKQKAKEYLRSALRVEPNCQEAKSRLAPASPSRTAPKDATEAKEAGNTQFSQGNYAEAIHYYSEALKFAGEGGQRHIFFANRAACHQNLRNFTEALKDANAAIALSPSFTKALLRRAMAYEGLLRWQDALDDYNQAKHQEGGHAAEEGRQRCKDALRRQ